MFNADGSSCYGTQRTGTDNTLETDLALAPGKYDTPTFAAVGYPAFGTLDGHSVSLFAPVTGLIRALDVVAPEYQGGQDFIGAWNPEQPTLQNLPGFPAEVNDLQFLTGPAVGQITAGGGQQVIGGTASLDLAAFSAGGRAGEPSWPKLTGDWTVATPTLGSFGTLDTAPRRAQGRRLDHPLGHALRLRHARAGLLAELLAALPPRHRELRRLHPRRGPAGRAPAGLAARPPAQLPRRPGGDLLCGRARSLRARRLAAPVDARRLRRARAGCGWR